MSSREALAVAITALERLADPHEMAGFGNADTARNYSPEMAARLNAAAYARAEVEMELTAQG